MTLKREPDLINFNNNYALYENFWLNPQNVAFTWPNIDDQQKVLHDGHYFFSNYGFRGEFRGRP